MATERWDADWLTLEGVSFDKERFALVWLMALATYGVGDLVTSIALIWFSPLYVEANPLIAWAISLFGGGGFLALKLWVFYLAIGISIWAGVLCEDRLLFYGPPIVLTIFGIVTTAFNLHLMLM